MVKLADTLDLGSNAKSVQVQVLSSVPTVRCKLLHRIFRFTKSQLCCAVGGLVRCARFSQMLRAWFSLCLRSSVPINQKRTSLVRFFAFLARITGLVAIEDYQQTTFVTCTACSWRDWCVAHQSLLRSLTRYKSCHPYHKNDSASCFFLRSKAYRFLRTTKNDFYNFTIGWTYVIIIREKLYKIEENMASNKE